MATQTIIQLRELDANSNNYNAGDYDCILSEPITMKDGDELSLESAFIDTRDVSTTYINLDEDTEISMTFYLYNMNHNGATKFWGCSAINYSGPREKGVGNSDPCPVWRSSVAVQDGQPYFLCTADQVSPFINVFEGIRCRPIDSSLEWGGTHLVFSYYDSAYTNPNPTCPTLPDYYKLPLKTYSKRRYITLYLPLQPANTTEYIIPFDAHVLTTVPNPPPTCTSSPPAQVPLDEVFVLEDSGAHSPNDLSLKSVNTQSSFSSSDWIGYGEGSRPDEGMPTDFQLVMIPVEQSIQFTIPAGKYIPAQLTKIINDNVVNFKPNAPIGISGASLDPSRPIPISEGLQRLPFNPEQNTSSILGGMPTFTQTNFIQQPDITTYQMNSSANPRGASRNMAEVKIGDSFFCNACPVRTYDSNGIEAENQALNPGTPNLYAGGACYYQGNGSKGDWARANPGDDSLVTPLNMAAFIGASQFALEYDTDDNYFKFNYLHTPLYAGDTSTDSAQICNYYINSAGMQGIAADGTYGPDGFGSLPSFQRVPSQDGASFDGNAAGGLPSIGALVGYNNKYVGSNGGIVFTSLQPASFWQTKLGFDLTPAQQDDTTGEITREGMISHYNLIDIGNCPSVTQPDGTVIPEKRFGFDTWKWTPNGLSGISPYIDTACISPQMPMIPFKVGMNATAAQVSLESAIIKDTPTSISRGAVSAWWLVQDQSRGSESSDVATTVPDGRFPDVIPSWITPGVNIVGDNTTPIRAGEPRLLNVASTGYFLVSIDTKINNKLINGTETKSTIAGVVNRYYSVNSFTSAEGSSIAYTHRGEPQLIRSVRVRILNPDFSLADVGNDSSIFLTLTSAEPDNFIAPPPVETNVKK